MWREFIQKLSPDCTFFPPATPEQIAAAEAALGMALPEKLKGLLAETNGMWGGTGETYIWPLERIEKDNHRYWTDPALAELYMPFNALLFFGDDGAATSMRTASWPGRSGTTPFSAGITRWTAGPGSPLHSNVT
jgi:cell wall assembly regulator SMI1